MQKLLVTSIAMQLLFALEFMPNVLTTLCKLLAACATRVRFNSEVYHFVLPQPVLVMEPFMTYVANVRAITDVHVKMLFQVASFGKCLLAVAASERLFHASMVMCDMLFQLSRLLENAIAKATLERV